jgi:hypothetical protein
MTFGLCNAPTIFQSFINDIFSNLIDQNHLVVYLNDILLFHNNLTDLHTLTYEVLSQLAKYDLYLKSEKCSFDQTFIDYLGVIILYGKVKMDSAKISDITKWPQPKKLKDLQSFLGFCNFYRQFIQNYSHIAQPLFALSKKDVPFLWTSDQEKAFCTLIHAFFTTSVIILPNTKLPFCLITDASNYALGAILEQSNALNHWHPVAFYSKSMINAKLNYNIHDKELLAIIKSLKHFCHYLEGHPQILKI